MLLELAAHSLRNRPLRTGLTAAGIAVAVGSMVLFLSLGEGLRQAFAREVGGLGPELQISFGRLETSATLSRPELPLSYLDRVRDAGDPLGVTSVTPVMLILRGGLGASSSFVFHGFPAETDPRDLYPGYTLAEGRDLDANDVGDRLAVIGRTIAERRGLELGDELRLDRRSPFEIVGVAEGGGLLGNAVLAPLSDLQDATGITDRVSLLMADVDEPARAGEIAAALEERFPDLGVQTQSEVLRVIERGLRISDVVRLGISVIALIVGAIAVANTVLMSVFERTQEFGLLRAVGARPRYLFALVLTESVLLSLVGGAVGVLVGWLGTGVVNAISADIIGLDIAAVTPRLVAFALATAGVMGLVSGLLPSAHAARIQIARAVSQGG